ncbi:MULTISPECIES: SMP-30/gluconolactonase/LRE family protein [Oceanobacillus]|uniref:SMP-30/gluconolactonase/LRE family protein n=1 Tax=Oceanobacillus profundus TaxID=372463 RepID=A0A417YC00_9BACI|nr:SMP-30/gluconolactonase/LRE family protein [Oceanobacillus profundus]RHW30047.1 SMP-30/gluconolactonase/LRE family protein [Oceanobacillus profundus]
MEMWELVQNEQAQLGESPSWNEVNQVLYWIDSKKGRLYIYNPKNNEQRKIEINEQIGCVVPRGELEVVIAAKSGIYSVHLIDETKKLINNPNRDPENIFNDGKCDPRGRFWVGTMNGLDAYKFSGELFCIDRRDRSISTKLHSIGCSNGITWSPDFTIMYYIDTLAFEIAAFDYNIETAEISNRSVVVKIPDEYKLPDGMSGDTEGMLWVSHWDAGIICRWNPHTGNLLDSIQLPAPRVTSCVFGGEKLNELYVTSAREGLSKEQLEAYPSSGGLFRIKLNVQGLRTYSFI